MQRFFSTKMCVLAKHGWVGQQLINEVISLLLCMRIGVGSNQL